ncbi:hypothetical protein BSKO_13032 [Bryopsis sp. KO-2023]|nr:hypothetical protein BSKO_13032 [Bryopsis sp. KO-2023]
MSNPGPPPMGYPGAPGDPAVNAPIGVPIMGFQPPDEQFIVGSTKRPYLGPGLFASSPMLCVVETKGRDKPSFTPLKLTRARMMIECHIATAFVVFEFTVDGSNAPGGQAVVFLPKHYEATVTEVKVENLERDSLYTTLIIPKDEAGKYAGKGGGGRTPVPEMPGLGSDNDPELFTLPFGDMRAGDSYNVQLHWFQPLMFQAGQYRLDIPLEFPVMMHSGPLNDVLTINCTINTGVPNPVNYSCATHALIPKDAVDGRVTLVSDSSRESGNSDFSIGYNVWGQAIVASVNVQPPGKSQTQDPRGSFALSVSPPAPDVTDTFQRSVVYVVDRSGSMTGNPIEYARNALNTGLDALHPEDQFSIIAYDHEQISWSSMLLDASGDNIKNAREWMHSTVTARGLTDILTPLQQALSMLKSGRGVPYVFLLTDGAVDNEREIARYLQGALQSKEDYPSVMSPRVSTFAIGPYCNHYFLKQLAVIGRGQFDVAFRPHSIQTQMERMLQAASKPVLTEVSVSIADITSAELYPFPIPDLFVGLPLLVSGKYEGVFPMSIQLNGRLPTGETWTQTVQVTMAADIPLDKVFVKQRLDVLTSAAWLQDNDQKLTQDIVTLSVMSGVPSAHTVMVGFETNKSNYEDLKKKQNSGKKISPAKFAVGGVAAVAILGGVGLAIGFGDIGASIANAPVMDVISGGLGDALEGIGTVVGDAAEAVGGLCADCCGDMGDCLGDCFGGIGDCLGDIGDCCESCLDCIGDIG